MNHESNSGEEKIVTILALLKFKHNSPSKLSEMTTETSQGQPYLSMVSDSSQPLPSLCIAPSSHHVHAHISLSKPTITKPTHKVVLSAGSSGSISTLHTLAYRLLSEKVDYRPFDLILRSFLAYTVRDMLRMFRRYFHHALVHHTRIHLQLTRLGPHDLQIDHKGPVSILSQLRFSSDEDTEAFTTVNE